MNLKSIYNTQASIYAKSYFDYLGQLFKNINYAEIELFISELLNARNNGNTIFFIGNGGSSATASHFANDLAMGTKSFEKPFKAICLTDNHSITTAVSNDYGFKEIFKHQLKCYARPNDAVVAISASGNSPNLVNAIEYANANNLISISLTGFDGGALKKISKKNIHVSTDIGEYAPVEDIHMTIVGLTGSYLINYVKNESL